MIQILMKPNACFVRVFDKEIQMKHLSIILSRILMYALTHSPMTLGIQDLTIVTLV